MVVLCFVCFDLSDALRLDGSSVPTETTFFNVDAIVFLQQPAINPATLSRVTQVNGIPQKEKKLLVGKQFLPDKPRPDTWRQGKI